jgi:hypothetical protein
VGALKLIIGFIVWALVLSTIGKDKSLNRPFLAYTLLIVASTVALLALIWATSHVVQPTLESL